MSVGLVKQLAGRELEVATTPAGVYVRLLRKADKACLAWAVFQKRSGGVRLYLQADVTQAPKALRKHVVTTGRKACLNVLPGGEGGEPVAANVAAADLDQARGLLLWLNEHAPAKGKKPVAKTTSRRKPRAEAPADPYTADPEEEGAR